MGGGVAMLLAAAVLGLAGPGAAYRDSAESLFDRGLDLSGDRIVDVGELTSYLSAVDAHGDVGTGAARAVVAAFDADGDGRIDRREFMARLRPRERPAAANAPTEVHLSLAARPGGVTVMWTAGRNYTSAPPTVRYGTDRAALNRSAAGTSSTYDAGVLFGFHSTIFTATMSGLEPGARYWYSVGAEGSAWSEPADFAAPWPPGGPLAAPANVSVAMFGDMGVVPFGWLTYRSLAAAHARDPFDAVHLAGDIAYAGVTSEGEFTPTWDVFMGMVEPLVSRVPLMTTVGNHEKYYNFTSFLHRFSMPGAGGAADRNFWFSYALQGGAVHVTSMSTEHNYTAGSAQHGWLAADMASDAARAATWRVLSAHRPFLCSDSAEWSSHRPGSPLIATIEPLLLANGYDLVLTGHMHCSELAPPSIGGRPVVPPGSRVWTDPGAPVYVTQGNAGALLDSEWEVTPPPVWSAYRSFELGFGRANFLRLPDAGPTPCATNATAALRYQYTLANQTVADTFWLCK